jgi:glycosyltransferase involved in cell wall biosynthesis
MSRTVTIIIPTYNGEKFIQETITSCLNQTFKNIDIMVIDDLSTDSTVSILKSYGDKINLITNKHNLGIVKNINFSGLAINTDYFIFLGHDDVLPKNHVATMVSEFNSKVVAVHCNSVIINESGEQGKMARDDITQQTKTNNCLFELSIDNFISSCGMMHRTSVFKDVNGWDNSFLHYGEWLYYIRALECGKIKYTKKTRAFYRRHSMNITNTFKDTSVLKSLTEYKRTCRVLAHKKNNNSFFEMGMFFLNNLKLTIKRIVI